ncbi:MAG: DNA/RNA non-specific endonuclease, partial [Bacteroidia bacterium]
LAIAFLAPAFFLKCDGILWAWQGKTDIKSYLPNRFANDTLLERKAYIASYSSKHGQSAWVLYQLKKEHLYGDIARKNNFKEDPDLPGAISPLVYTKSGYDRGHLAPAADFSWSEQAMVESFYMSNMSPQLPGFNRGIWKKLEDQVRKWAEEKQDLIVVVGPVLNDTLRRLKEIVSIPDIYFKVILDKNNNDCMAFLMKNEPSKLSLETFAVSIDSVEKLSGIDFFCLQDTLWQQKVECCLNIKKWNLN